MTEAEKLACKKLKKVAPAGNRGAAGDGADDETEEFDLLTQLKQLAEQERSSAAGSKRSFTHISRDQGDEYINADFVLGSASEVERQWSIAGNLLAPNRS
ncbi:unnamed protein product [Cylindrotheca closterium]|uniref:Uncharacterized protein n=1 Tax=Cylindrotheca closterium TaxID=2856 RepID=A0AAD2PY25_9STRA|nr:unnamed protein product [Cylindrotheca closterium]